MAREWDRAFANLELAFAHPVSGQHEKISSLLEKDPPEASNSPRRANANSLPRAPTEFRD